MKRKYLTLLSCLILTIVTLSCNEDSVGSNELLGDIPNVPSNDTEIEYTKAEFVDMGTSVSWAKWNIGENSEFEIFQDYGWGDITGCEDYSSLDNFPSPFPPNIISGTKHDIANIKWGEGWRLPTYDDFIELWNNSIISIGEYTDITYYKFRSKINGNIIYLPIGESLYKSCYWTGNLYNNDTRCATAMHFKDGSNPKYSTAYIERNKRVNIRPVYEHKRVETLDATKIKAKSVKLNGAISYMASQYAEDAGFYFSKSLTEITSPHIEATKIQAKITNKNISADIPNLTRNTAYYFRAYTVINGDTFLGEIKEFVTLNAYEVGELYPDDTNPKGVVFKINQDGTTGKIVSLDQTTLEWQAGIPTYVGANNIDDGSMNNFPPNSPIPAWVGRHGTGWYCPAKNELHALCSAAGLINKTLRAIGKTPIENFYWASTQYSATYYDLAWIVNVTENDTYMGYYAGWSSYNSKSQKRGVLAIRKF